MMNTLDHSFGVMGESKSSKRQSLVDDVGRLKSENVVRYVIMSICNT